MFQDEYFRVKFLFQDRLAFTIAGFVIDVVSRCLILRGL